MEVADAKDAGATLGVSARELVAMVVGLSFLWPYPLARSDTFFPLSFVFDGAAEFESHSVVLCQMAFSGFLILASVLIIMGRKRLQEVMTARWRLCAVFVAVAGFGSTVGLLAVDVAGPMRLPLALCMLLVCALWIAICVVMWGEALSRVGGAVSLLIVCVSFLLCQCVYLVLTLAALPMGPYLALCPAVMGAALAMQTCRRAGPLSFELVSVRDLPVSLFLSSLVVVICSVLGAQLLPGADANQMSAASRVVTFVTSMVVIGAIAGWCLVRGWSRGFVIEAYAILTILIVAGFVVVIVAQTMGLDFSQRRVVVTVAQCFGAYLFAVLLKPNENVTPLTE